MTVADEPFPFGGGTRSRPQPWEPEQNRLLLAVLGKLAEENSECGAIAARCIIQGLNEREPVTGKLNREALEDEIADIFAQGEAAVLRLGLDRARIEARRDRKIEFTGQWYDHLTVTRSDPPADCTMRLRSEGKPAPKSGCFVAACKSGGMMGCIYDRGRSEP